MNSSLSVVLPLYNVESALPALVEQWLELLPELVSKFEIVLVDDGSTDATLETAQELSRGFPQVQLLVHPARLGAQESLRSALRYVSGELLLVSRDIAKLDPHEIVKLWESLTPESVAAGWLETPAAAGQIPPMPTKFARYMRPAETPFPDILLVPQRLLAGWRQPTNRDALMAHLREAGYSVNNYALRASRKQPSWAVLAARMQQRLTSKPATNERRAASTGASVLRNDSPSGDAPSVGLRRPHTLLAKLRALAWGE